MQTGFDLYPVVDNMVENTMRVARQRRTPQSQIEHREQLWKVLNPDQNPINLLNERRRTGRAAFGIPLMGGDDIRTRIVGKFEC